MPREIMEIETEVESSATPGPTLDRAPDTERDNKREEYRAEEVLGRRAHTLGPLRQLPQRQFEHGSKFTGFPKRRLTTSW